MSVEILQFLREKKKKKKRLSIEYVLRRNICFKLRILWLLFIHIWVKLDSVEWKDRNFSKYLSVTIVANSLCFINRQSMPPQE